MNVKVLHWPHEAQRRSHYAELGVPRILVLQAGACPPPSSDLLEEWVTPPITSQDIRARVEALGARARAGTPVIDGSGILRLGGRWVALSPADMPLARALIASYQDLLSRDDLLRAAWPGDTPSRNALDLRILRLRRRIAPVGLSIYTVRGQGYLLGLAEGPP